jgi:hypothetical protein
MLSWKHKGVLAIAAAATFAASAPQEADAFIFRWWRDRCAARQAARVTYFAPTACGTCNTCQPVCQPACPQQVCSYQPQTCYRTVTQQVPVTVYRPVTTVDPCTGCPSTTMQACTTMTTQVQRVPVTTFRQVCQLVQPQPTCSTCPTTTVGMPVVNAVPAMPAPPSFEQQQFAPAMPMAPATPGCAGCQASQTAVPMQQFQQPQVYQQQPQPYDQQVAPQPQTSLAPADQTPVIPQTQSNYPTFPSNNSTSQYQQYPSTSSYPSVTTVPSTSSGLYPVPSTTPTTSLNTTPSTGTSYQPRVPAPPAIRPLPDADRQQPAAPALLNPQDRTAARELPATGSITPISWQVSARPQVVPAAAAKPVAPPAKKWDNSGWVPAR